MTSGSLAPRPRPSLLLLLAHRPARASLAFLVAVLLTACGDGGGPPIPAEGETVKTFKKPGSGTGQATEKEESPVVSGESKEEIKIRKMAARLEEKFKSAKEAWQREEALLEMGQLLGSKGRRVAKTVRSALKDEDEDTRIAALGVLAIIDPKGCAKELAAGLTAEEEGIQIAAIRAWRRADIADVQPLLDKLEQEFDQRILTELAITLKEKAPAYCAAQVGKLMAETPSLPAVRHLVEYIEKHKAVSEATVVASFMDRDDKALREACARTLGTLNVKAKTLYEGLCSALKDDEESVRTAAVTSLRSLSGQNFGFDPKGAEGARTASLTQWMDWAAKQK